MLHVMLFLRVLLSPKLVAAWCCFADILIPSWSTSDKPAAIDGSGPSLLRLNPACILSEAGVVAGSEGLGWKCVLLVVETFDAWNRTAGQIFHN